MTNNAWNTPDMTDAGNGKLLIGQTSGRPLLGDLVPCGFDITKGANSLEIDTISTGLDYDKITATAASDSSTIEFTGLSSTYHAYKVVIKDLVPASDGTLLYLRTSTDNGTSFDSGASEYKWSHMGVDNDGSLRNDGSSGATQMILIGRTNDSIGNNTNETCSAELWVFNPSSASHTRAFCQSTYVRTNGDFWVMWASGVRVDTTAVDAIQLLMDTGNITSGNFTLYGLKA